MNKHGRRGGEITQNENNQVEFGRGGCKTHSRGRGLLRKSVNKRMEGGGSRIGGRQIEAWGRGYEEKV